MTTNKKKKNCNKGYSCGATCISVNKGCPSGFPTGVSVALDKSRTFINKLPKVEKPSATKGLPRKLNTSRGLNVPVSGPKKDAFEERMIKTAEKISGKENLIETSVDWYNNSVLYEVHDYERSGDYGTPMRAMVRSGFDNLLTKDDEDAEARNYNVFIDKGFSDKEREAYLSDLVRRIPAGSIFSISSQDVEDPGMLIKTSKGYEPIDLSSPDKNPYGIKKVSDDEYDNLQDLNLDD